MKKTDDFIKKVRYCVKCGETREREVKRAKRLFKEIGGSEGAILDMIYIKNLPLKVIEKKTYYSPRHIRRLKKNGLEKLEELL